MPEIRRSSLRLRNKKHSIRITPRTGDSTITRASYGSVHISIQNCKYKYRGCNEKLELPEIKTHESQCRYRWYKCEGRKFALWNCHWKGYHEDIMHHFQEIHPERTYMKVQNVIDMNLVFDTDSYDIELIKKRKQLFWFKHRLLSKEKVAYWVCQYVGPQDEALTYCYELVISDEVRKFAVTELCYTDALDADEIYESGKCVVMTFDQIKSFMTGKKTIHVYFRIKKKFKAKR